MVVAIAGYTRVLFHPAIDRALTTYCSWFISSRVNWIDKQCVFDCAILGSGCDMSLEA
jgi:hypothetical protein